VEVDAALEAALPSFLASRREALGEMAAALSATDRVRFKRLAHKLAGSFHLYGFRWAAEQCRSLEKAATDGEAADLARATEALREHLDTVKVGVKVPLQSGEAK
jgi:HPt (histidine-containing phosphotransfer) domain-containing protein